jgi:hypothetical protein
MFAACANKLQTPHMKIGDTLVSIFGYDARIATFYKVVGTTPKSIKVAELLDVTHTGNWDDGTSAPQSNSRLGHTFTKRLKGDALDMGTYGYARVWNGTPVHTYNHH